LKLGAATLNTIIDLFFSEGVWEKGSNSTAGVVDENQVVFDYVSPWCCAENYGTMFRAVGGWG
jgi:hypothetical protein